jgi:hypothetical protein
MIGLVVDGVVEPGESCAPLSVEAADRLQHVQFAGLPYGSDALFE